MDLYIGYSLPLDGPVSVDIGGTYYHYPQSGALFETEGGAAGSYEVYGSVGLTEVSFSPAVTAYYDFTLDSFTLEGSLGHNIPLPAEDWSVDLGLTGGHVDVSGGNYQWATGSASIGKSFDHNVSFYVGANFTVNSDDDTLDFDRAFLDVPLFNDAGEAAGSLEVPVAFTDSSTKFWFGSGFSVGF